MFKSKPSAMKGFTIIELLIATVVFSAVLVVVLAAFVQTSRLYYKGINMNNTQEDARILTQNIADDLKFLSSTTSPPSSFAYSYSPTGNQGQFCVGIHRYDYQIGSQVNGSGVYGLERDTLASPQAVCPQSSNPGGPNYFRISNPEQLLDSGMQLNAISVGCINERCTIDAHVVFYGSDSSVLYSPTGDSRGANSPDAQCTGSLESSQFCAVADYDRTVSLQQG